MFLETSCRHGSKSQIESLSVEPKPPLMGSMHGGISGEELGMLDNFRRS